MPVIYSAGPFLPRLSIAALFLYSGIGKIMDFTSVESALTSRGLPAPVLLGVLAIIAEVGGGLSLLLGIAPRWGASVLLLFTIVATLLFHLDVSSPMQMAEFLKNTAIAGGLIGVFMAASPMPRPPAP
jgi:putative oxidoreductase